MPYGATEGPIPARTPTRGRIHPMADPSHHPGQPDLRGPFRYIWWLIVSQRRRVLTGSLLGSAWMVGLMVPPYLLSRAIDDGLVLADPHTVVLDEATALLDPRTARRTERALAAVLVGRTVIAVAHRLHTAHDADRVAVMDGGRLTELGSHDELVAAGGTYAALWRSWHGDAPAPA